MSTMNISLPETLKSFVDEQLSQRGYGRSRPTGMWTRLSPWSV